MRNLIDASGRAFFLAIGVFVAASPGGSEPPAKPDPLVTKLIAAHNKERIKEKLPPLTLDAKLEAAAVGHARDMAEHEEMSHNGSDGSTPAERVERAGYVYRRTGENVAWGQPDIATVMRGWMDSPPHKENILGDFTEIGVARATSAGGAYYWSVSFGRPPIRLDPAKAAGELVDRINEERAKLERPPIAIDPKLAEKAQAIASSRARDKDAPAPNFEGIDTKAYKSLAMSNASGQTTVDAVAKTLLESPDHKKNLLGDPTRIGVGYATAEDGSPSWCLILGVSMNRK